MLVSGALGVACRRGSGNGWTATELAQGLTETRQQDFEAMRREWKASRFDFAVNFEASPLQASSRSRMANDPNIHSRQAPIMKGASKNISRAE